MRRKIITLEEHIPEDKVEEKNILTKVKRIKKTVIFNISSKISELRSTFWLVR